MDPDPLSSQSPSSPLPSKFLRKLKNRFLGSRDKFFAFVNKRFSSYQVLLFLAMVTAVASAVMALLLKTLVHEIEALVIGVSDLTKVGPFQLNFITLISPAFGIALTLFLVRFAVKDDISHGLSKVLQSLAVKNADLPPHSVWSYVAGCSLTAGFGGSVGMEAPILATGSGIGSNLGRLFNLGYKQKVVLVGCGAAAAIGAIFKAPIAGLIIALEILAIDSTAYVILPILFASAAGASISMVWSSRSIEFFFAVHEDFHIFNLPWYLLLGLFCGLVSVVFTRASYAVEDYFRPLKPLRRFLVGASLLGLIVFLFPPLFGEGYETMKAVLSAEPNRVMDHSLISPLLDSQGLLNAQTAAWLGLAFLVLTLGIKVIATALTTSAGGVGGIFAPSLFLGCLTGYIFARTLGLSGIPDIPETNFALAGMAGILAGVMQAPLSAIFLIAEISGGYRLFIPLMICTAVSVITARRFEKHSIYTHNLAKSGQLISREKDKSALGLMRIDSFIRDDAPRIAPGETLENMLELVRDSSSEVFAVTEEGGKFHGFIFVDMLRPILFAKDSYEVFCAQDVLLRPAKALNLSMRMKEVIDSFPLGKTKKSQETDQNFQRNAPIDDSAHYLPVLDAAGIYLGYVYEPDILEAYRQKIMDISSTEDEEKS